MMTGFYCEDIVLCRRMLLLRRRSGFSTFSLYSLHKIRDGIFSHALKEGVYGRIHFPTCWCVYQMPEHVPLRMEEAYRAELVKGCPEVADNKLFYQAVVEACAFWMLDWYHEFPLAQLLEQDRLIVTSTVRQRFLMRSELFTRTTEEFGHLEALGKAVKTLAMKLSEVWAPDEYAMPFYPAFR